jgi:hypothetical protein
MEAPQPAGAQGKLHGASGVGDSPSLKSEGASCVPDIDAISPGAPLMSMPAIACPAEGSTQAKPLVTSIVATRNMLETSAVSAESRRLNVTLT